MSRMNNSGVMQKVFSLFSIMRLMSFVCLVVFLVAKFYYNMELSVWFAAAYPIALIVSWCFLKFVYYKKYPNMRSSFVGTIIMADIVTPLSYFLDSRNAARIWNVWHFRNYKEKKSIGEIVVAWVLRLIVLAVLVAIIIALVM